MIQHIKYFKVPNKKEEEKALITFLKRTKDGEYAKIEKSSLAYPHCLVLGFIVSDPVHSVVAIDRDFDRILIVTLYRPSAEKWENDWKTRKKQN